MAKADKQTTAPSMPKMEPRAHIGWDAKDLKPSGLEHATMGKAVTVTLTGKITGYSMNDYGCSIDLEPTTMALAKGGRSTGDGPSMVEHVEKMGAKYRKKEA